MDTIKAILFVVILVGFIVTTLFYIFQRHLIYAPDKSAIDTKLANSMGFKEVMLNTQDGLTLKAWYQPAKNLQPTIIYYHGNAGNLTSRLSFAKEMIKQGFGLLLVEYRGYGGNAGSPSEKGLYLDGQSALNFLDHEKIPDKKRVLFGSSMGTGVAVEMALNNKACALILQSPFTSLPNVAKWHYPWLLISPTDKFDSQSKIDKITMPLLIIHGQKDSVVPYAHGIALHDKAMTKKQLLSYPLGNHNNLLIDDFYQNVSAFIRQNCST